MDIRELKLLAEFSHPNIVKFVSDCAGLPCKISDEMLIPAWNLYSGGQFPNPLYACQRALREWGSIRLYRESLFAWSDYG